MGHIVEQAARRVEPMAREPHQYAIDRALYKAEHGQDPNVPVDSKGAPRVEPPPGINSGP